METAVGPWDCFRPCGGGDSWSRCIRLNLIQIYCPTLSKHYMVQTRVSMSFYSHLLIIPCWSEFGPYMYHTWFHMICGRSFCKSSQDTFISCLFSFSWLFPCLMSQRSWIIWLIAECSSSLPWFHKPTSVSKPFFFLGLGVCWNSSIILWLYLPWTFSVQGISAIHT